MTRGTHQVGAFTAALGTLAFLAPNLDQIEAARTILDRLGLPGVTPPVGWPALLGVLLGALLGGTAPDLDKPRRWWGRFLARSAFGGHRHLSHSLTGFLMFAVVAAIGIGRLGLALGVSPTLPFLGFAAGYLSHLVLDSLTIEGVPWLFPVEIYLGFPPLSAARIKTGSLAEQFLVMPALLLGISWIGYHTGGTLLAWWR